jgi:CTP synthase
MKKKISLFCNVDREAVITGRDMPSIYSVPLAFHREGLDALVVEYLNIWTRDPVLDRWTTIAEQIESATRRVTIGIVGKYVDHTDAYKSLHQALLHGGMKHGAKADLRYIDSEDVEKHGAAALLDGVDALLVPGGFGKRGVEGKIAAIRYARESGLPFFGICLGLQVAVIEFARNVCGISSANSVEFDGDAREPVIHLMAHQHAVTKKGGSMRLGAWPCALETGSLAADIYGESQIDERHRHRYEVNNEYRERMQEKGLRFSGLSPDGELVEMIELPSHQWFVGCQFHPEFKSRPYAPHPLFAAFVAAAIAHRGR